MPLERFMKHVMWGRSVVCGTSVWYVLRYDRHCVFGTQLKMSRAMMYIRIVLLMYQGTFSTARAVDLLNRAPLGEVCTYVCFLGIIKYLGIIRIGTIRTYYTHTYYVHASPTTRSNSYVLMMYVCTS